MFSNLAADTVQGALLNLAIIADLELFIAKLERGSASRTASDCWTSFGRKTGDLPRPRTHANYGNPNEILRDFFFNFL